MKPIIKLVMLLVAFQMVSYAQTPSPQPVKSNQDLAAENAALKKENQELRKLLASKSSSDKPSKEPESAEKDSADSDKTTKQESGNSEFWLSKSGKRHNSDCRYFKKSEGKSCSEDEGTACGICGG